MYDAQQCGGNVEIQTRYAPRTEAATIPNAHDEMTDDRRILQHPRSALSDPAEPRPADEWDIRYATELDTGLAQKFAAQHKATGQRGIVKCGWPGTIVKEYLWPRILHALNLPAAPAQLVPIPDALLLRKFGGRARRRPGPEEDGRSTCTPIGALIHWIAPAESAEWLWDATAEESSARGVAPAVVVSLQALALWAGGLEPGEFMLVPGGRPGTNMAGQTPFVIDMQDGLFIDSFGRPQDPLRPPHYPESVARLQRLLAGPPWRTAERQQAIATIRSLQRLSAAQIGWITQDADRAVTEATLPKGTPRALQSAWRQMTRQTSLRRHPVRLTQDWAEQVATIIGQVTGPQM